MGPPHKTTPVPVDQWIWHGTAGHLIVSSKCCFRLHTEIGDYRISTVGCYHPARATDDTPHEIGSGRLYETMVFRLGADRDVTEWLEIDSDAYNDEDSARAGHVALCEKWAAL